MSYEIDYDEFSSPSDVYDVVVRSRYHSLSSNVSRAGNTSYRIRYESGQRHHGNAWAAMDNPRYGFETNAHGHVSELRSSVWLYVPDEFSLPSGRAIRFWNAAISYSAGDGHSGGDQPDGTNGWSVRNSIHNENGPPYAITHYVYNMGDRGYTRHSNVIEHGWNYLEWNIEVNTWSGSTANADGVSEMWANGDVVYSTDGWRWTIAEDNMIEYNGPAAFGDSSGSLYYDRHTLSTDVLDDPSPPDEPDPAFDEPVCIRDLTD